MLHQRHVDYFEVDTDYLLFLNVTVKFICNLLLH